jgi:hypothetical protein
MSRGLAYYDIKVPGVSEAALVANLRTLIAEGVVTKHQTPEPQPVLAASPVALRRAVETLAYYFKREFGYDFVSYHHESTAVVEAWLWTKHDIERAYGIGYTVFYRDEDGWRLATVWLHPYVRREGLLTAAWPTFQARYGSFWVETPWSPAMDAFLRRQGYRAPNGTVPPWWPKPHVVKRHTRRRVHGR